MGGVSFTVKVLGSDDFVSFSLALLCIPVSQLFRVFEFSPESLSQPHCWLKPPDPSSPTGPTALHSPSQLQRGSPQLCVQLQEQEGFGAGLAAFLRRQPLPSLTSPFFPVLIPGLPVLSSSGTDSQPWQSRFGRCSPGNGMQGVEISSCLTGSSPSSQAVLLPQEDRFCRMQAPSCWEPSDPATWKPLFSTGVAQHPKLCSRSCVRALTCFSAGFGAGEVHQGLG